jgi:hypothetical protein
MIVLKLLQYVSNNNRLNKKCFVIFTTIAQLILLNGNKTKVGLAFTDISLPYFKPHMFLSNVILLNFIEFLFSQGQSPYDYSESTLTKGLFN